MLTAAVDFILFLPSEKFGFLHSYYDIVYILLLFSSNIRLGIFLCYHKDSVNIVV